MTDSQTGDYLLRVMAGDDEIRGFAVLATQTVSEAQRRHGTLPAATAALGRTMTAAVMMGAMLKGEEKVFIQVLGDGPAGRIMADADARGGVRGYIENPLVHLPPNAQGKIDVARAVGKGQLVVIKDLGLKEPYRGTVPLVSGELGEDFAYYFLASEQVPSAVVLGVLVERDGSVRAAGGMIIQLMPGAREELADLLTERFANMPPFTRMIDSGMKPEEILHMTLGDLNLRVLEQMPVRFHCTCSRERLEQILIAMGREELEDMLAAQQDTEVTCRFCSSVYRFTPGELKRLILQT
ncbi:MAG: Hsp33 family molecular chaperone HslO [Limnochordia bacterium]|jgi:molecular chaperone Hsp33|nr:Hsp33 family molecular chaperone HslO [Bacillota bacterium]